MGTVTISTVLWDANEKTEENSRCFTDVWAHRFFNGFRRNITLPTRCVLFTDRRRDLPAWIEQIIQPDLGCNGYGDCVRPFQLNEPMIFAGLDTIVVGHCDKFARYCLESRVIALPKHPYEPVSINGVVFCPAGQRRIFDEWRGENDMKWMRRWPHASMDNLWPGRIVSYKARVRGRGQGNAAIIYFHGKPKMHEALGDPVVAAAWR
jgi:hypothetical protein